MAPTAELTCLLLPTEPVVERGKMHNLTFGEDRGGDFSHLANHYAISAAIDSPFRNAEEQIVLDHCGVEIEAESLEATPVSCRSFFSGALCKTLTGTYAYTHMLWWYNEINIAIDDEIPALGDEDVRCLIDSQRC